MARKTNPRRIPRTGADCDRAWKEGCIEGIRIAEAVFMTVLKDKHSHEVDLHSMGRDRGHDGGI